MCKRGVAFALTVLIPFTIGVRINFTNCHYPEWSCTNNVPNEIVYTCSAVRSSDFIIHLKDFYTDQIHSITVQNCRDLRVVLDCPILQRASRLQKLIIKDCDRLEFISLSSNSLLQTPPEVRIENVREIVSFPRNIFKSPNTNTELKCMGAASFKKLHVINSKINSINTRAIYNVSGIKSVEFENVTITDIQTEGIEAFMGSNNTLFSIINSKFENMDFKAITVQSFTVKISSNVFADVIANVMNISSDNLFLVSNKFKEVCANGITTNSVNTEISDNTFESIKSNAVANVRCSKKRSNKKYINFSRNTFKNVEPYSLYFDHASCKSAGTQITFRENKIDCRCRNISFLNSATYNEQNNLILNLANNNTCLVTHCILPVEVVKLLLELDMCHLNLDPQVMCLLYNDKQSSNNNNNEVTTDDEVTEPAPTFYLIRQANSLSSDTGAAMTAIDKDDLLKDSHLNLTNRTLIKFVFDSSKDFVETLRSTSRTRNRPTEKAPPKEEYVSHCIGTQCRNDNVYNRQRALDFYKYVYAQLRTPRQDDNKLNQL
ncbi:uncharacterized protein LOC123875339 [Maniola jurtina]|uniref:uncharacterized protein LOC123875339 n=1 Tax=Maniola jurtina TaxID=191418 RepID=UPI001E68B92C|nr:uncharacterized protein LOC123875339 [Maniola jurtina]XP_045777067.1 uncharacterized protein LOC123875339 [Maniola jurtina]XP_045777068.1 uncharacterized protein LOC123875339 [Maniola jurtina]XP_045777069.1 uncharacterized protein LOC123875339 [Maniola jurtina]